MARKLSKENFGRELIKLLKKYNKTICIKDLTDTLNITAEVMLAIATEEN